LALNKIQRDKAWLNKDLTPTQEFAELIEDLIQEFLDMATNAQLISTRPNTTGITSVYTALAANNGGRGTTITQFMATEPAGAATYSVYIGSSATDSTKVISSRTAAADGDSPPSIINQLVKPGESIFVKASAGNTIVFYASGTERR